MIITIARIQILNSVIQKINLAVPSQGLPSYTDGSQPCCVAVLLNRYFKSECFSVGNKENASRSKAHTYKVIFIRNSENSAKDFSYGLLRYICMHTHKMFKTFYFSFSSKCTLLAFV